MIDYLMTMLNGITIGWAVTYLIFTMPTDIIKIPLKNGQGQLDGRVVHFHTIPHGFAKLQKPTGTVYEVQTYYPNGEYYNSYPYFASKYESQIND